MRIWLVYPLLFILRQNTIAHAIPGSWPKNTSVRFFKNIKTPPLFYLVCFLRGGEAFLMVAAYRAYLAWNVESFLLLSIFQYFYLALPPSPTRLHLSEVQFTRWLWQGAVVRRLDNAIHRINRYTMDTCWQNKPSYILDSDLSGG